MDAPVFDIKRELKKLPDKPGVYIMHGEKDEIIYVGKAISLKRRVRQYFEGPSNKSPKILKMVTHIRRFEYIVLNSELEALVMENNLIKENKPKYNTLLKDDKTYPYIKVTKNEDYPRAFVVRRVKKDNGAYFGPYTSGKAVKDTLLLIHKLFKIRNCNRVLPRDIGKDRPCLYYHMGLCEAPCAGFISKENYNEHVKKTLDFLSGKYDFVCKYLKDKMNEAANNEDFEKAIEYRDMLSSIDKLREAQNVSLLDTDDRDIIGIGTKDKEGIAEVFFIRNGRMIGREYFHLEVNEEMEETVKAFIMQYYSGTPYIPREIWVQCKLADKTNIEGWLGTLKGSNVHIVTPIKGKKEHIVEIALSNAFNQLEKDADRIRQEEKHTLGALNELKDILNMPNLKRIEAYDISNTSGVESVASMIVFVDGRPKPSDYRKFRIKTVIGPNDYASLREVLFRRFTHEQRNSKNAGKMPDSSFKALPDLILMDGGKGQVNIALRLMDELGLKIPICGMVKDDKHNTRGLYYEGRELDIAFRSEAFKLITRIQDETHRFAIEYHRSLLNKGETKSILDDIKGVGEARRKALLRAFKDIEHIKEASEGELEKVDGITKAAAANIYEFFHKKVPD